MATPRRKPARRPPPQRAHYHHGDLRRALIATALDLIATDGPEAWTLREVARRVGVSQTAPYRHFADKRALLVAVAREGFAALRDAIAAAQRRGRTLPQKAKRLAGAYLRFAVDRPAHFRVMFSGLARDPAVVPEGPQALAVLERLVADAQAAGLVRQGDIRTLARALWAATHGVADLVGSGALPPADGRRVLGIVVETTLAGLAPP